MKLVVISLLAIMILSQQTSPNLQGSIKTVSEEGQSHDEFIPTGKLLGSSNGHYDLATTVFNAQNNLGDYSNRCKSLKYFAFRQGNLYLTAYQGDLKLAAVSAGPTDSQLFQGIQNMDGTWGFRVKGKNKFLRADNNGITINYQTFLGPWERWWIERHQGTTRCHIQSAQFTNFYWIFSGGLLQQTKSAATDIILQFWPELLWGWNW